MDIKGTNEEKYLYADEIGGWNITYPIKVYDSSVDRSKETREQGIQSAIGLLALGSLLAFLFLNSVLKSTFGLSSFWAFLIVLLVIGVIAIYVFRFGIFKEDDKLEEFNQEESDNLGKFYEILNGVEDYIKVGSKKVPCYKYSNGRYAVCLKLRHGSSSQLQRVGTKGFMEDIANILGRCSLSYKQLTMGEHYIDTPEYDEHVRKLNNMDNKKLQQSLIRITEHQIEKSEEKSLVDVTYIIIYAKSSYQKYAIASAVHDILKEYRRTKTVFRDYFFLTHKEYIEVCKEYYGVDVIDLSTIRATTPNKDILMNYKHLVGTVNVETTDGRKINYEKVLQEYLDVSNVKDL